MFLDKSQLLNASLPTKAVDIGKGEVRIKAFSVKRRVKLSEDYIANIQAHSEYERDKALPDDQRKGVAPVTLADEQVLSVMYSIVDENDEYMFDIGDYDLFCNIGYTEIEAIAKEVRSINSLLFDNPVTERQAAKKKP